MNNKESKSYKDMYHFDSSYYPIDKSNVPSIESEPAINVTIKKNPYRSNVEIEKDEIVLKPDLSALFKAKGKTHAGGGMDVLLEPESFVFSNDKTLALNKEDCETFELEMGGYNKGKSSKYTPAETLKKNIDVKHYNTLTSNLQDVKKDDLAKKSSLMMLEKYFKTLGNIAFVQEGKKGFPQGVPAFSVGTAPVYDTELKGDIDEQKQYAKYGGKINPSMQYAGYPPYGWYGEPEKAKKKQKEIDDMVKAFPAIGWYTQPVSNQKVLGPWTGQSQQIIEEKIIAKGKNPKLSGVPALSGVPSLSGVPPLDDTPIGGQLPLNYKNIPKLNGLPVSTPGNEILYKETPDKILPGDVTGQQQTGKDIDWEFTPWQRLSMGYDAYKYASAKRYMPFRSRFNPSYIDPALVNPEQLIGDIKSVGYQQSQAANTLSPILRNAQQAGIFGQMLNQIPGVRSQYDNQNVGILNQARQYNNQVRNTAQGVNMKNDQDYYQQTVIGQSQFDNMKSFLADRLMNNIQGQVQSNQDLALKLMAQGPDPAYSYDFRRDRYTRNPQNISNIQGAAGEGLYKDILKGLEGLPDSEPRKWEIYEKVLRQKNILPYLTQQRKKGGVVKNPYRY